MVDEYIEISDIELIYLIYIIPNLIYNNYVLDRLKYMNSIKLINY